MKIAILDPRIQAPGLTKLFPEADYFVINHDGVYDLNKTPDRFNKEYGFNYREDLEALNDTSYDLLFIVYAVYDFKDKRRKDVQHHLKEITKLLARETFDKVVMIANDDNALDPVKSCRYFKADFWFKRNYQLGETYAANVVPFPFVMFGPTCPLWRVLSDSHSGNNKIDRVIWAGDVGKKKQPRLRNRNYLTRFKLFNSIIKDFLTPIQAPNDIYLYAVTSSKFALDMNGRGDPNYRIFELLTTDTLILQQFKYMVWPFEDGDGFSEETIFKTPDEFIEKLKKLRSDPELYDRALTNQRYLKEKYFQVAWLRNYLMGHIFPLEKETL